MMRSWPLLRARRALARALGRYGRDGSGVAATEFALWATALIVPILSATDVAYYVYQKMEVQISSQAGVQAAWHSCDSTKLPAVKNCAGLTTTVTSAVQSSSLGTHVTVPASGITEGYYCVTASNALQLVGTAGNTVTAPVKPSPFTCATVIAGSTTAPGDYIQVSASYTYAPVFTGLSLAALLTTPIVTTAWMRLN